MLIHIIIQLFFLALLIFLWARRRYRFWTSRGIPGPSPKFTWRTFPYFIGYFVERLQVDPIELELQWLKKYGKVYGVLMGAEPVLTISEVSMVKQVLIKDFHLFVNRREMPSYHEMWTKNIFTGLEGLEWKRVRSITSPAFSTGRLRKLLPYFMKAINKLDNYLEDLIKHKSTSECASVEFEVKPVMAGFTLDVIAGSMYGIDTESNKTSAAEREAFNAFRINGHKYFQVGVYELISTALFPRWVLRLLRVPHQFPQKQMNFFAEVSRKAMKNPCGEDTLMGMLQKAHQNYLNNNTTEMEQGKFLTENEVIAQSVLFFTAAFETVSSALSRCLHELSLNPTVQQRLFTEVQQLFQEYPDAESQNTERFYYKVSFEMPYLEAVMKETLRMYPVLYRLERRYNGNGGKGYKLGGVELEKDQLVEISTIAVHYDEDYWTDPMTFNPDRFMPENKNELLKSGAFWIPFGEGSRNCVGKRFGEQEFRFCLAFIINRFRFETTEKTPKVLENYFANPLLIAKPFNLRVSLRT